MTLRDDASSIYKSCIKNLNPSSRVYDYLKHNNFFEKDQDRPSATLVISGDIFKIYFDENVDLNLIKENLQKDKRNTKMN